MPNSLRPYNDDKWSVYEEDYIIDTGRGAAMVTVGRAAAKPTPPRDADVAREKWRVYIDHGGAQVAESGDIVTWETGASSFNHRFHVYCHGGMEVFVGRA